MFSITVQVAVTILYSLSVAQKVYHNMTNKAAVFMSR